VAELYAEVRAAPEPQQAHARWRAGRDVLFRAHPQSPLPVGDPLATTGLPYWPYDRGVRFVLELLPPTSPTRRLELPSGENGSTTLASIGRIELPAPYRGSVEVWWLDQYGGGLFLPLRDGTAGSTSYGGGRYLLDTAKGADLGGNPSRLVIDLNFLYHPSCRYDDAWLCPLAPPENTIAPMICAGERLRPPTP
jgi:uncharacterized protein (DUF1684 family)